MLNQEEIQIAVNKILEMVYWLYQKDLKAGIISKDIANPYYGKIYKKRNSLKNNDDSTLFNYGK